MKKYRIKKPLIYTVYVLTFTIVFGSIYLIEKSMVPERTFNKNDYEYVSKINIDNSIPVSREVNGNEVRITRPYLLPDIELVRSYYDYKDESEKQMKSLIYYEDTYMQSSGVSYGSSNPFDVVAILDGTVMSIREDNLLGKIVEIRHSNGIISSYQSLGDVNVKENENVKQGDIIGQSGENNIAKELGNHLYFEMMINGINVNPEVYYGKNINEIEL